MNPALAARRMIFENHNNTEAAFTNDQILDEMKDAGLAADSVAVEEMEDVFRNLCESGLARNIAQNLATVWLKLFEVVAEADCPSCGRIWLGGRRGPRLSCVRHLPVVCGVRSRFMRFEQ